MEPHVILLAIVKYAEGISDSDQHAVGKLKASNEIMSMIRELKENPTAAEKLTAEYEARTGAARLDQNDDTQDIPTVI